MAHLVETMAYVGAPPWHGLGNVLQPNRPIEDWLDAAGMNWSIRESSVLYSAGESGFQVRRVKDARVLYRSDTQEPLSVVSNRYKVVQPREVLEFFRDLVRAGGDYELETAGVLKGGRKLWALAKTGLETQLKGGDTVKAYLLLATSSDGTLCTTAQATSVRVCCANTLKIAIDERTGAVKVPHSTTFDPVAVKRALGVGVSQWDQFKASIKALSERKVNRFEAMRYLVDVLGDKDLPLDQQPNQRALQSVYGLFAGQGKGSTLASSDGTAWGLLNAVTEHVDHHRRARGQDYRLDSAWFGQGAATKAVALEKALALV